jgi:hypothetical protein
MCFLANTVPCISFVILLSTLTSDAVIHCATPRPKLSVPVRSQFGALQINVETSMACSYFMSPF